VKSKQPLALARFFPLVLAATRLDGRDEALAFVTIPKRGRDDFGNVRGTAN